MKNNNNLGYYTFDISSDENVNFGNFCTGNAINSIIVGGKFLKNTFFRLRVDTYEKVEKILDSSYKILIVEENDFDGIKDAMGME